MTKVYKNNNNNNNNRLSHYSFENHFSKETQQQSYLQCWVARSRKQKFWNQKTLCCVVHLHQVCWCTCLFLVLGTNVKWSSFFFFFFYSVRLWGKQSQSVVERNAERFYGRIYVGHSHSEHSAAILIELKRWGGFPGKGHFQRSGFSVEVIFNHNVIYSYINNIWFCCFHCYTPTALFTYTVQHPVHSFIHVDVCLTKQIK